MHDYLQFGMISRRSILTTVSVSVIIGLAGCVESESSGDNSESGSDSETESNSPSPESGSESEQEISIELYDKNRNELKSNEVVQEFFAAAVAGNKKKLRVLSHPLEREDIVEEYSKLEGKALKWSVERVNEKEATTGEQSASQADVSGVEQALADDMAEKVQWVFITLDNLEQEFYAATLRYNENWFYYESV